jgi:hypothetical protein
LFDRVYRRVFIVFSKNSKPPPACLQWHPIPDRQDTILCVPFNQVFHALFREMVAGNPDGLFDVFIAEDIGVGFFQIQVANIFSSAAYISAEER